MNKLHVYLVYRQKCNRQKCRTFSGPFMVALLPIDIGKSATLIISLKKYGKCNRKAKKLFQNYYHFFYHPYILPKFHF